MQCGAAEAACPGLLSPRGPGSGCAGSLGPSKTVQLWFFCFLGQSPSNPLSCCFINTVWPTCLVHGTQCPAWCLRGQTLRKWSRWESGGALSSHSWPLGRGCWKWGPKSTGLGVLARAHLGSGWRSPCCEPVGRPPGLPGRGLRRAFLPCTQLSYPHLLCLLARLRVGRVRVPAWLTLSGYVCGESLGGGRALGWAPGQFLPPRPCGADR